ncbi:MULTISPECIES: rRNA maturation RNase YbeY [unclassified Thermosynechococcus]|uniref:rRNA maturation RNase YbeY n=1 Tax=unclassified Thermosynechococcus TaxID=2622553 RepID=UPI00197D40A9|nr:MULTISPECIES: rRNA maturation RNase YbeY [unclassified Thermosynechococcus]MDR5638761.1 rRNA maturation RNase YbeY [Thermosynechococcus sp. PP42]QSF48657.1 rRNA maturation RNase YbeY [Thermosynechococcus sp. TA-1]WKT80635.1 rRNA maturation RNase YbeY [Thermosynechococcus sp. PP45]WNC24247.1 rRNA maturation RNase YbeY [Thermosynechococcus sp. PP551]WNC26825.1 rRNA maturation RNase YbeY [Thermosynechococcus sp. PP555]
MTVTVYLELHDPSLSNEVAELPWQVWFRTWIAMVEPNQGKAYEVTLRLTTDAEIQVLNHQYRDRDTPTDVLAFATRDDALPLPLEEPEYLGDIIISGDTARKQARERGYSLSIEVTWLACHGLLHLLGWDHPDETQLARMLAQQAECLRAVGLTPPYSPDNP